MPFILTIPLFENMPNFTINKNCVFQGEIIFNFSHIHCELRSILLVLKQQRKRGVSELIFSQYHFEYPPFQEPKVKSN